MKSKLKKTLLVMLSAVMVFNTPLSVLAESAPTTSKAVTQEEAKKDTSDVKYEIVSIKDYDGTDDYGTFEVTLKEADEIDKKLPETVSANVKVSGDENAKEEEQEVPVSWSCPDEVTKAGTYTYTVTPGDGYVWSDELQKTINKKTYKLPAYTVSVVEEVKAEAEAEVETYASNPNEGIEAQAGGTVVTDLAEENDSAYYIADSDNYDYVMDTKDHNCAEGQEIIIETRTQRYREDDQMFVFIKYDKGDYYWIRKKSFRQWRYITVADNGATTLNAWYGDGKDDAQLFQIIKNPDGSYSIYNKKTGLALGQNGIGAVNTHYSDKKWNLERKRYLKSDPNVTVVKSGDLMNGTYSFAPRINKNTEVSVWGYNEEVYTRSDETSSETGNHYRSWNLAPSSDDESGKFGFWIKDVGSYQGQTVDLKTTISWDKNYVGPTGKRIPPTIQFFTALDAGDFAFGFRNASYEVKYDVYINDQLTPINLRITATDIDNMQYTRLITNTGTINNIFCVDNERLFRGGDSTKTNSGVIFSNWTTTEDSDLYGWVSFELKDTSSFSIVYGAEFDCGSYLDCKERINYSSEYRKGWGDEKGEKEVDSMRKRFADPTYPMLNTCGWMRVDSRAFGPISLPAPTETVSKKTVNPGDSYYYDVYQLLPKEVESFKFKTFTETIEINRSKLGLTTAQMQSIAGSVVVRDDSARNITQYFDVKVMQNAIQCILKPEALQELNKLYGSTLHFRLRVPTMSAKDALKRTLPIDIVSKATTTVTRKNTNKTETVESNQTTIKLVAKYYFKVVESYLNGFTKGEGNVKNKTAYKTELNVTKHQEATPVAYTKSDMIAAPKGFHFHKVTESGKDYKMSYEPISRNLNFQAEYSPINYKLTYDLNGGTLAKANPTSYNVIYSPTLNEPTKEGYIFDGWTISNALFTPDKTQRNLLNDREFKTQAPNVYDWSKIQIYTSDGNKLLHYIGTSKTVGDVKYTYTHNLPSGNYSLRIAANGSLEDGEYMVYDVYLDEGRSYEFTYRQDVVRSDCIHIKNVVMKEVPGQNSTVGNFVSSKVALYDNNNDKLISEIGTVTKSGNQTMKYKHEKESGYYTISFLGCGNNGQNQKLVSHSEIYLEKGAEYEISFNVTFENATRIAISDETMKQTSKITGINEGKDSKSLAGPDYYAESYTRRTGNLVLVANWRRADYTVHYDGNGSEKGSMNDSTFIYDKDETLPKNLFTKTGYTFDHWNKKSDGSDKDNYKDQATVNNLAQPGKKVTLFAQWREHAYTIKYDQNGGNGSMPDQNYKYSESKALDKNKFTKDHATFIGWNTKKDGSGKSYTDKQVVSKLTAEDKKVITLYAQWDLAPEIKAGEKTFYEGTTVTRDDLLKDVAANDPEEGVITNQIIITKIEYSAGKLVGDKKQPAYTQEWKDGMPSDAKLDTWFMQLDKADSPVKHKVTYKVVDKAGNVTTKTVTVYVKYNNAPVITTMDRYYTLKQAQSGVISADELLKNSITNNKMKSTDIEEGNLSSKVELVDFNPTDFTKLTTSAVVTVTYRVHDSYGPNGVGKETINQFKVYVTDPDGEDPVRPGVKSTIVKHVRFITKKYYDLNKDKKDKDLTDEEIAKANANGGLRVGCSWYSNPEYKSEITATFDKTSGTTYKFSHEDVEKIQDYINTNGIGNAKKVNSLSTFYQKFLNK